MEIDEHEMGRAHTVANMVLLASALAHRSLGDTEIMDDR